MQKTIYIFFLFFCLFAQAQTPDDFEFRNLGIKDGLSQTSVYCVHQDSQGFIWLGTQDGLNKFDGYNFSIYRKDLENKEKLSNNWINDIYEDSQKTIWIASNEGLNRYNRKQDNFTQYKYIANNPSSISHNEVNQVLEDSQGELWIATNNGLNILDRKTNKFRKLNLHNTAVSCLAETKRGEIWVGTKEGIIIWDKSRTHFTILNTQKNMLSSNEIHHIYQDQAGIIWVGTKNGLNQFDRKTKLFKTVLQDEILRIYEDSDKHLWVGTFNQGLNLALRKEKKIEFIAYLPQEYNEFSIPSKTIYEIYEDKTGSLWIGTYGGGVSKLDRKANKFWHHTFNNQSLKTLSSQNIRCLYEDKQGSFWVGTVSGLNKFDPKNKTFNLLLEKYHIRVVFEDSNNNFWVGTRSNGLLKIDRKTANVKQFQYYEKNKNSLSNNFITVIYEDKKQRLWIGTKGGGLNLFDYKTQTFKRFQHNPKNKKSLPHNIIYAMTEDKEGNIWVGTRGGGIALFNPTKETFLTYRHNPQKPYTSLSSDYVLSLFVDRQNKLWIGTSGGGFNKFNLKTKQFIQYREEDGLPNDVVYSILEDSENHLWLSTNKGLSKFNKQTNNFKNYDARDGLQGDEFNFGAYFQNQRGEMFFGGISGFNVFKPQKIKNNPSKPLVLLTEFKIFNEVVRIGQNSPLQKHISLTKEITLEYNQNSIEFDFVLLNFTNSEKNRFQYILEGLEESWTETNSERRFANYTNLDPGTYTFRVKGYNNDGVESDKEVKLKIIILRPYWATWWFQGGLTFLLVLIVFSTFWFRMRYMRKQRKILEYRVQQRTAEVTQQKEEIQRVLENLQQAQGQLVQSEKMASLGQLTAGIAHEINNPINFVSAGIQSLENDIQDLLEILELYDEISPESAKEKLEEVKELKQEIEYEEVLEEIEELIMSIKRGAERTTEIVKGLRTFSRLDEDVIKQSDVKENIESTLIMLRNQYKERIEIVRDYGEVPKIDCYPGKLNQVFMNLFVNAIQAIEGKGKIFIKTEVAKNKEKPHIQLSIGDTGKGIPETVKQRIFEPFFTTKDVGEGTGLGLSITYNIIQKHQGKISVESGENQGTIFIITLPVQLDKENEV